MTFSPGRFAMRNSVTAMPAVLGGWMNRTSSVKSKGQTYAMPGGLGTRSTNACEGKALRADSRAGTRRTRAARVAARLPPPRG